MEWNESCCVYRFVTSDLLWRIEKKREKANRIYSNKHRRAYLIFRATSATLIRGRRLIEGGAYSSKYGTLLNSGKLETVWGTKCSGQLYHISLFFEIPSAKVLRRDLHLICLLLDCRKLTRSKLVKRFNCVDSNEEMTKQCIWSIINKKKQLPVIRFEVLDATLCLID